LEFEEQPVRRFLLMIFGLTLALGGLGYGTKLAGAGTSTCVLRI
jgi:hypothetical protein